MWNVKPFIVLALLLAGFSSVNAENAKPTFADEREKIIKLADGLKSRYDTVLIVADINGDFVVLTDSVLFEKDEFDGFSILTAHQDADSVFIVTELDPEKCSFNFSRDIISELLKTKTKNAISWENWEFTRPYSVMLIDGKVVFEHFVPRCWLNGVEGIECINAVTVSLLLMLKYY